MNKNRICIYISWNKIIRNINPYVPGHMVISSLGSGSYFTPVVKHCCIKYLSTSKTKDMNLDCMDQRSGNSVANLIDFHI